MFARLRLDVFNIGNNRTVKLIEYIQAIEKAAGKGNFSKWVKEACKLRLTLK